MHGSPTRSTTGALICFSAGVLSVTFLGRLPDIHAVEPVRCGMPALFAGAAVVVIALSLLLARVRSRVVGPIAVYVCATTFGHIHAQNAAREALQHRAPPCVDGAEVLVRGRVMGLPLATRDQVRFDLKLLNATAVRGCTVAPLRQLRVTWYAPQPIQPGETWAFRLKLRSVRGFQNAGAFDYEAHLLERRIDASATVRAGRRVSDPDWRLPAFFAAFDTTRQRIADHVATWSLQHRGILLALVIGDAREMPDTDWDLFRRTGTVHLMVISGMHISLAAAGGFLVGRWLVRLCPPLIVRLPARHAGAIVGVLFATAYSGLAGAGIPVQRAWVMTIVGVAALLGTHRGSLWFVYVAVLAIVLAYDPLAVLDVGFWLSFGAVAVLLAAFAPRTGRRSPLEDLGRAQWVLFFAMLPVSAVVLGQVVWVAPLANLFAVPVTSLAVLPLLVCGLALEATIGAGGATLWTWADILISVLLAALRAVDVLAPSVLQTTAIGARCIAGFAAALWLLPLRGSIRLAVGLGFLPLCEPAPRVPDGEVRITVLDVGQGQSVIVDTARHRMLYDAGPRHLSGFDLGRAVVIPAFRATGRSSLDLLMLSHGDLDHVGGATAVRDDLSPRAVFTGSQTAGFEYAGRCRAGHSWQWDGVRFRILHPGARRPLDRNDESCVLSVTARGGGALLPGDISASAESAIIATGTVEPVTLLVIPHHGGRFSSSDRWVAATGPLWAVASAGHANRFGHPHPATVAKYRRHHARVFNTAESGALVWSSTAAGVIVERRYHTPPYWRVGERLWTKPL